MRLNRHLMVGLAGALLTLPLAAGSAMAADGASLYQTKTCFACHGPDANTPIMPLYPKLAGQNKEYAVQQMKDIKSGARANGMSPAMKAIMQSVSDDEIAAIAEWLATLQ